MAKKPTHYDVIRERWLRGKLDYKLHDGQKLIRDSYRRMRKQLFVGECSRQFGKSFLMVVEALEVAFQKPKGRVKYGTAFLTDLEEFILPAFEIVLEDCPEEIRPKFKSQKSKWKFYNGAEIKLVGLDRKPNGLRGNAIDLIILDEAAFMSRLDYLYKSVIIPATTHRPDCKVLVVSTPPESPAHEFLDYVEKAEYEGSYKKFTIYDNPMVDEPTIQRLMDESGGALSTTWRREYLCEHVTDENTAVVAEWDDKYWVEVERDEYYQFYNRYVSMDLGIGDYTAVLFGYYDYLRGKLIIEYEHVVNGPTLTTKILQGSIKNQELQVWNPEFYVNPSDSPTLEYLDEIEEAWEDNEPRVTVRVSDNNNPLLLQDLSFLHGLHFIPTDKGTLQEMVNTLKMMVRQGEILVHPRCKQLRGCMKYGVWDKHRRQFGRSKVYGHFDALASLIYMVRNLNRSNNPIPHDFQIDPSNNVIFQLQNNSDSASTIRNAFRRRN